MKTNMGDYPWQLDQEMADDRISCEKFACKKKMMLICSFVAQ